jgi:hypothetical protein
MKFLRISSLYPELINSYYNKYKFIRNESYEKQYNHVINQKFSISNFLTKELEKKNIKTCEIISNLKYLQHAWLKKYEKKENKSILAQQILHYNPDVIFFGNLDLIDREINEILNSANFKNIIKIGYHCAPINDKQLSALKNLTFLVTCVEDYKKKFKNIIDTILIPHAFDISCLDKTTKKRDIDIAFIGSLFLKKELHYNRINILYEIIRSKYKSYVAVNFKNFFLNFLQFFLKNILTNSVIVFKVFYIFLNSKKAIFGKDMYEILQRSKVMINLHINDTQYSGNMRLFEGTGCGCLVVTDKKKGTKKLFIDKKEIFIFNNNEVIFKLITNCIDSYQFFKRVSFRAQKKTLSKYHYKKSASILLNKIYSIKN